MEGSPQPVGRQEKETESSDAENRRTEKVNLSSQILAALSLIQSSGTK
jgi:hypothetical protein